MLTRLHACGRVLSLLLLHNLGLSVLEFSEGHGRDPVGTLSGVRDLSVQFINLFQGESLGFIDEEVHEGDADEAAASPDEEYFGLQIGVPLTIVDEVRCRKCNCPVQQPICRGSHTKRFGSDLQGEDFSSNNPKSHNQVTLASGVSR